MKKAELKKLMESFDTTLPIEVVSGSKIQVKIGDKTFTKDIESDAGISQALGELKSETDTHAFMNAFKPAEDPKNKVDKDGAEQDEKAKKEA